MIAKKETQGIYSYLVFEIEDADELDEFSLGMLSNNGTEAPEMFRSGANAFFDAFATV